MSRERTWLSQPYHDVRPHVSISNADPQQPGIAPAGNAPSLSGTSPSDAAILRLVVRLIPGFLIGVAVVQWIITTITFVAKPSYEVDYTIYYSAALALRADPRANIYDLTYLQQVAAAHHLPYLPHFPYLYPPFLALVMEPLASLPLLQAEKYWNEFCLVCWLACTLLLVYWLRVGLASRVSVELAPVSRLWSRQWHGRRVPTGLTLFAVALGVFVSFTYEPLLHVLILGQISGVIFLLLLAVPWLMRKRLPEVAGLALALATMLKLFPILLIGYFIVRRQWRVALGAALGFVAMGTALLLAGVPIQPAIHAILTNGTAQDHFYNNQALAQLPIWLAALVGRGPGPHTSPVTTLAGYVLIALVALTFVVVLLRCAWQELPWRTRYRAQREAGGEDRAMRDALGYAWAIATMLLVSPILWQHYQPWELAPMAICLGYALHRLAARGATFKSLRQRETLVVVALIVAYVASMNALPFNYDSVSYFTVDPYLFHIPLRPFFMLLRPLSAVLIWLASGYTFVTAARDSRPEAPEDPHIEHGVVISPTVV